MNVQKYEYRKIFSKSFAINILSILHNWFYFKSLTFYIHLYIYLFFKFTYVVKKVHPFSISSMEILLCLRPFYFPCNKEVLDYLIYNILLVGIM